MAKSTSAPDDRDVKIAVTGASGLIGSALIPALRSSGHEVVQFVRKEPTSAAQIKWDPTAGNASGLDRKTLEGVHAVVHLSGAGVGDHRWTQGYKKEIYDSRVLSTRTISEAIASTENGPKVLVSASAIGIYGDTGDVSVDESSTRGSGFLADVVDAWEQSADTARQAGVRVVHPRTGLVVSAKGGAWGRLLPLFKLGLGGQLGSGKQYWSFISIRDEVRALQWLIDQDLSGPVNLTAPTPVTNAEVTRAMSRALKRPALLPVPGIALRIALGEFSIEVLGSARVLPTKLEKSGFTWTDPTIDAAISSIL